MDQLVFAQVHHDPIPERAEEEDYRLQRMHASHTSKRCCMDDVWKWVIIHVSLYPFFLNKGPEPELKPDENQTETTVGREALVKESLAEALASSTAGSSSAKTPSETSVSIAGNGIPRGLPFCPPRRIFRGPSLAIQY